MAKDAADGIAAADREQLEVGPVNEAGRLSAIVGVSIDVAWLEDVEWWSTMLFAAACPNSVSP